MTDTRTLSSWPVWHAGLAAAMCCGLAMSGGCTRTSDGTIVARPIALPSYSLLPSAGWWRRAEPRPQVQANEFPEAPTGPAVRPRGRSGKAVSRTKPKVPRFSVITKPLFKPAAQQPARPLTCRNMQAGTGKVRVVCS